ncbi:hypothetical protein H072_2620 [Dactylellina haptotyla CBS 200.50]|uniref:Sister chromatid cohesion protein n=1 Tax=Dactylellina haptotyla (strain CBS 200.50) TaxID=1284197 RepID=S8AQP1_DACHA|nr:hypothetical protein H072_2620 [Dactylellina haptotyla CBS 200.50]
MDGYNRGGGGGGGGGGYYHHQQQQVYGGGRNNSGGGGGGGPPSQQQPTSTAAAGGGGGGHAPFYSSQHAGFNYNFNYVPPSPYSTSPATPSRPPAGMHPGYPPQNSHQNHNHHQPHHHQSSFSAASPSTGAPYSPSVGNPPSQYSSQQQQQQQNRPRQSSAQHYSSPSVAQHQQYGGSGNNHSSTSSNYSGASSSSSRHNSTPRQGHHQARPSPSQSSAHHQQQQNRHSSYNSSHTTPAAGPSAHSGGTSTQSSRSIPAPTSIDEALQYTPLNSILPFHGHIIPTPVIDGSSLAAKSEAVGQKLLKDFNRLDPMSKRFRTATNDISGYINSAIEKRGLQLEFKKSKASHSSSTAPKQSIDDLLQSSKLGSFETSILHKLPAYNQKLAKRTPLSTLEDSQQSLNQPSSLPSNHHSSKTPSKASSKTPSKKASVSNASHQPSPLPQSNFYIAVPPVSSLQLDQSNGYPSTINPSQLLKQEDIISESHTKTLPDDHQPTGQVLAAIVLPPPKEGFTPTDYSTHEEADAKILVSNNFKARKRRKIDDSDDREALIASVDTRAKGESALHSLQTLLVHIFESEDNLQPDTSGNVASLNPGIFIPPGALGYSPETTGQCLSLGIHVKLDHAIRQVILYNRFESMDIDDITRLIKICENTLKAAENLDVKVDENTDEASEGGIVSEYDQKIAFAENTVKTCRTILRLMNGGRSEKQIYSEEALTSIHNVIKNLLEGSITPLIALRSDREDAFKAVMSKKKMLRDLLQDTTKILKLLTTLLSNQEVTEDFTIKMIYTSVSLVFIDNATSDKDSVFGTKKVENLRLAAMNILAKIFARYPDQGDTIITEVLGNLEKLPVGRQSAKNFPINGSSNIQLISAFMMMLVQSAGSYQERAIPSTAVPAEDNTDDEMANGHSEVPNPNSANRGKDAGSIMRRLDDVTQRFLRTAQEKTAYVTSYIVNKALITSKSSENSNSRNLLDLMVEDFDQVLDNPEWPAAELFMKTICIKMIRTVDDHKQSVPAKSAALELLGKLGSCISDNDTHLKKINGDKHASGSTIDGMLSMLTDELMELTQNTDGKSGNEIKEERDRLLAKMIGWKGPFRMILEYLWDKDQKEDADNLQTAWGFFASVWAARLGTAFEAYHETDSALAASFARVADNLHKMITEKAWYDEADEVNTYRNNMPTPMQIRHAYLLITLAADFCSHKHLIRARLIHSIDGEQTSARSKGLKALMNLVEKDLSILDDRNMIPTLLGRCKDASPQVRDSALDIIGRCLALKPELEARVLPTICSRAYDTNVPLRKRAIKLLRDIYPSTKIPEHKVDIAKCLLMRVVDHETSVAEQARKCFEELWVNQYFPSLKDGEDGELSLKGKLIIKERVSVITKVVTTNDKLDAPLSSLIQFFLDSENKQVEQNSKVCRLMVQALFDDLIDSTGSDDDKQRRQSIMRTLVVFARASASLFKVDQLDMLKPYIKDLSSADDMSVYRSAIVIFRCVLPGLSAAHSKFLEDVAGALLSNVSKLPTTELPEAIFCLAEINKSFDISGKLISVFCSSLNMLKPHFGADTRTLPQQVNRKISRLICIVGLVGNYCPLENYSKEVRLRFAKMGLIFKNPTISEFIVDTMLGFAGQKAEPTVRKAALEAVGNVAKSHPEQYMRSAVTNAFEDVFKSDDQNDFKSLILKSLHDFLSAEERSSEEALKKGKAPAASKESVAATGADYDPGRLTGASTATSRDGVSTALAQTFLHYIIKIALGSVDDFGFAAVELTGSVLRQGLVHPKECTPALVALGTCPDVRIQNVAFRELKTLAQKHESIVERAYMEGFKLAFKYQLDVIDSEDGADSANFTPKLANLYALTVTSRKVKKKFLGNLLAALEFEPNKLQVSANPSHLTYARFILQNLAYFDYVSVEDVHQVATGLEKVVGSIGSNLVLQIETEVFQISLQSAEPRPVDPIVKRRLCMASVILTMCWGTRTYLRKLHGLTAEVVMKKVKNLKEMTKAPTKVVGMGGRTLWDEMGELMDTLNTDEAMDQQFREFVELLTVDNEFKRLAEHEDDDLFGGGGEGDESDDGDGNAHRGRGRPRKRKTGMSPPPNKAKRRKKKGEDSPGLEGFIDDGGEERSTGPGRKRKGAVKNYDDDEEEEDGEWKASSSKKPALRKSLPRRASTRASTRARRSLTAEDEVVREENGGEVSEPEPEVVTPAPKQRGRNSKITKTPETTSSAKSSGRRRRKKK